MSNKLTGATFDDRAKQIKTAVLSKDVKADAGTASLSSKTLRLGMLEDMKSAIQELSAIREGSKDRKGIDLTLGQYIQEKFGFAPDDKGNPESFYQALGIDPGHHTIHSLQSMPEIPEGYRWIVPEVVREAIRLGLRKQPIYSDLIAAETTVSQPQVILPSINMSNPDIRKIGEAETIPVGNISFDSKNVRLHKIGTGLKITDEVIEFTTLDLLGIYLQDVGVQIGIGLDSLAIDVLTNGEQADGSESAPVIGVEATADGITYRDILRAWLRMGRLGRTPAAMLSDESKALDVLLLEEFKGIYAGTNRLANLNVRTPIPQTQNYFIHGASAADTLMLIDPTSALIKLNVGSMKMENERIAERQLSGTYVTMMTGFATMFRDGRLIIDSTQTFATQGFPDWMDVDAYERSVSIK